MFLGLGRPGPVCAGLQPDDAHNGMKVLTKVPMSLVDQQREMSAKEVAEENTKHHLQFEAQIRKTIDVHDECGDIVSGPSIDNLASRFMLATAVNFHVVQ
ncbi:hypothetical protein BGX29_011524 [Mortierella sp. GBA35]|nr:hypothetical protein BGX29_011524 [Mortierella sp. GBA35]